MSNAADREKKRIQANNEKRLMALVKLPGNTSCCDCGANGPRWASFNIGCFVCIRCGGIHRRMGTHISKVKSISLDSWKEEQMQFMEEWGNNKVNALYLHNSNGRNAPKDDEGLEQYIRDKYERKRFFKPGGQVAEPTTASKTENTENGAVKTALKTLHDMGFTDVKANLAALKRCNLNVNTAIELLVNNPNTDPVASKLAQMEAMGFKDLDLNRSKLNEAKGDINQAINLVFNSKSLPDVPKNVNSKASSLLGLDPPQKSKDFDDDGFGEFASSPKPAKSEVKESNNLMDEFGDFSFHPQSTSVQSNNNITSSVTEKSKPTGDKDSIMALFNQAPIQLAQPFGFQAGVNPNANSGALNQPFDTMFSGMTSLASGSAANAGVTYSNGMQNNFSTMSNFSNNGFTAPVSQSFNSGFPNTISKGGAVTTNTQLLNGGLSNNFSTSLSFSNNSVPNSLATQGFNGGFPIQQTLSNNSTGKNSDLQGLNSAFASLDPFANFSATPASAPKPTNQTQAKKTASTDLNDLLDLM